MVGQPGVFDLDERYAALSAAAIRSSGWVWWSTSSCSGAQLDAALARSDRARGGRPPFDHVLMSKVLILQTQNNLSDERTEFYVRDRLTWMRLWGSDWPTPSRRQHLLDLS